MKLETRVLDQAIEWLLPKIGTTKETVTNIQTGEQVDAVQMLCVWCSRLRYNLIDHNHEGIDSADYPAWNGYRSIPSNNIYTVVKEMAKLYRNNGGITPDYSNRDHKDISKWTYKRIFGPEQFIQVFFDIEELWQATQRIFPELINSNNTREEHDTTVDRIDSNFLLFETYNNELADILSSI